MDRFRRFMRSSETQNIRLITSSIVFIVSLVSALYMVGTFQTLTHKLLAAFPITVAGLSCCYFCIVKFGNDNSPHVVMITIKARRGRGYTERVEVAFLKTLLRNIKEVPEISSPTSPLSLSSDPTLRSRRSKESDGHFEEVSLGQGDATCGAISPESKSSTSRQKFIFPSEFSSSDMVASEESSISPTALFSGARPKDSKAAEPVKLLRTRIRSAFSDVEIHSENVERGMSEEKSGHSAATRSQLRTFDESLSSLSHYSSESPAERKNLKSPSSTGSLPDTSPQATGAVSPEDGNKDDSKA